MKAFLLGALGEILQLILKLSWHSSYIFERLTNIIFIAIGHVILTTINLTLYGLGVKWRYMGYFGSSLHPREEKFGCYHDSKACLGDLKSYVVLSDQWQIFCK